VTGTTTTAYSTGSHGSHRRARANHRGIFALDLAFGSTDTALADGDLAAALFTADLENLATDSLVGKVVLGLALFAGKLHVPGAPEASNSVATLLQTTA
jgi:hypothetical protein